MPTNGDFSLKLVNFNSIRFSNKVNDSFFSAQKAVRWQYEVIEGIMSPKYFYQPDFSMRQLGCLEQVGSATPRRR